MLTRLSAGGVGEYVFRKREGVRRRREELRQPRWKILVNSHSEENDLKGTHNGENAALGLAADGSTSALERLAFARRRRSCFCLVSRRETRWIIF